MSIRILRFIPLLVAAAVFAGCDGIGDDGGDDGSPSIVVANQGNFGDGNGSVSVYDPETETSRTAAISSLGSIVQSVAYAGERLYVMSNTGGRVDVFDPDSFEQVAQITDVVSPRYLVAEGTTGYVTSLYGAEGAFTGGLVTVLDLAAASKLTEISVGNHPEGLTLVGSRLFVANHGFGAGSTVHIVDTETREVVDTVDVDCDGPRFLTADADADVFVFCTGQTLYDEEFNVVGETDGAVRILDGATGEITHRIGVDGRIGTAGPGQDAFHAPEAGLVFVVKDERSVLVFDTGTNALDHEIGPFEGQPISAVAYDVRTGRLYLGRSNGFTQAGEVSIHDGTGAETGRFTAGIVPTYIAVLPENP